MAKVKKKTKAKPAKKAKAKAKPVKKIKKTARKSVAKAKPRAVKKIAVKAKLKSRPVAKAKPKPKAKPVKKAKAPAKKAPAKIVKLSPSRVIKKIPGLPGELYDAAMKVLDERQAEDVVSYNLEGRSSMADYLIIATGRASRQVAAIADYLREAFMKLGVQQVRVEGAAEGNWVLVDAGDIVVHLFRPEVRSYYKLEDIWDR